MASMYRIKQNFGFTGFDARSGQAKKMANGGMTFLCIVKGYSTCMCTKMNGP